MECIIHTTSCQKYTTRVKVSVTEKLNHKNRSLDKNSFKSSGGIAVFVKEALMKYVIPINNTNKNSLWIKVKKEVLDGKEDIFVGTVYIYDN